MGRADPQLHQQFKVYDAPPVVLPIFRWFANPSIIFSVRAGRVLSARRVPRCELAWRVQLPA